MRRHEQSTVIRHHGPGEIALRGQAVWIFGGFWDFFGYDLILIVLIV